MNTSPSNVDTHSLISCPECERIVPHHTTECPDCGGPIEPGGGPTKVASVDSAELAAPPAAARKSIWRTTITDVVHEATAKETSRGRKVWLWFCLVFLILFVAAKVAQMA